MKITTDQHWTPLVNACDLSERERAAYSVEELLQAERNEKLFVRYRGHAYAIDHFSRIPPWRAQDFTGWDDYTIDSFFTGLLIKWSAARDAVQIGHYET